MSFGFNAEQEALRDAVKRFMSDKSPVSEVRRLMDTDDGYDEAVWRQMATELGLQGLHVPEEHGGQGFGSVELCIVLEEMGRALLCAPFFSSVCLAANALLAVGTEADRKEHLPAIASGETIATLALVEEAGTWTPDGVAATADGSTVSGVKTVVTDGHVADLLLVVAREPGTTGADGIGLYAVDPGAGGVDRRLLSSLDTTRKIARVELDGASATRVGDDGSAWEALETALQHAAVCLSNEMVGGAQRCFDMALEYSKERYQFGRPIGSFQAIKHRFADLLLDVESAKSAAYYAAYAAAEAPEELGVTSSLAKAYCSDAYFTMASENIQIHGGIGFTWEHDAHLYYKRAKSSELFLGDAAYHRERLAGRIGL